MKNSQWFSQFNFSPVVHLPKDYVVLDLSGKTHNQYQGEYGVGRYDEKRPHVYLEEQFVSENRNIHVGIDLGAPAGSPVHSFYDGEIFMFDNLNKKGDYGPTLILRYQLEDFEFFALYAHLSIESLAGKSVGQKVKAGEVIGWLGDEKVNGGWPPHVHFQLCMDKPANLDILGVVSEKDREKALEKHPDPRLVLGPLY